MTAHLLQNSFWVLMRLWCRGVGTIARTLLWLLIIGHPNTCSLVGWRWFKPLRRMIAHVRRPPPALQVRVVLGRRVVVVEHRAQPTEELRVDKLASALPPEVLVVLVVVSVQLPKVFG